MTYKEYLAEHGCASCESKDTKMTTVSYTDPLIYHYRCNACGHKGDVLHTNYQLPRITGVDMETYEAAMKKSIAESRTFREVVQEMGGEVDLGPEPKYKVT